MKIELPVRWMKLKTDKESVKERKLKRVIGKEDDEEINQSAVDFEYDPFVLDTVDVAGFGRYDGDHTVVETYHSHMYIIQLDFESFKPLWTAITGQEIKTLNHFKIQ